MPKLTTLRVAIFEWNELLIIIMMRSLSCMHVHSRHVTGSRSLILSLIEGNGNEHVTTFQGDHPWLHICKSFHSNYASIPASLGLISVTNDQ